MVNRPLSIGLAFLVLLCTFASVPLAEVFIKPQKALKEVFPGAQLERRAVYLSQEQQHTIEGKLNNPVGRFHTFYIARKEGEIVGYAIFDTHKVRTKEETLFIVLDREGTIMKIQLVSFFEPLDYRPPQRWLNLFENLKIGDRHSIPTISGATLTVNSVKNSAQKALLLHSLSF